MTFLFLFIFLSFFLQLIIISCGILNPTKASWSSLVFMIESLCRGRHLKKAREKVVLHVYMWSKYPNNLADRWSWREKWYLKISEWRSRDNWVGLLSTDFSASRRLKFGLRTQRAIILKTSAIDLAGNSLLQQLLTAPAGLCQNDVSAWVAPAIFRFATDSRNQPFFL